MRKQVNFLLQVFAVLLITAEHAFAIKCYNCDSSRNPECIDVSSSTTIQPEMCTPQILSSSDPNSSSWLQKLIRIEFLSQSNYNVAMLCQKISVVNERDPNDRIIVRSCQLDGAQTNPCSVAEDKIRDQQIRGYRIDHCSTCIKDNCNGAMGLAKVWSPIGAILLALALLVRGRLW
ncbi:uncharacterized protein DMENIID0001_060640 [Sergentomyia squamirostris]